MNKNGFSLIELSIVLIIIGLLIAGVSSGSKLIEQARVNKAVSALRDFKGSYLTFLLTYEKTPGDMNNAVEFFGATTADGGGNGQIEATAAATSESLLAWQHMSLAGVISGTFTQPADGIQTAGTTGPKSALNGACNAPLYNGTVTSNGLQVGTDNNSIDCSATTALLAGTVYKIDNKIDDGIANSGEILATSADAACQTSGTYDLDATTKACSFFYSFGDN
ncbi:MAG: prepilin-type N-terminal cleavage/methylation domain-containing protein [Rickettsiales bacterium]